MRDTLRRALLLAFLLVTLPSIGLAQWKKQSIFPGTFFNEVFFIDANHGWLTQHAGIVVRTADGGATWQSSALPGSVGSFNRDICFVSTQVGYVSGDDGIWKSTDGGVTWANVTPPNTAVTGNSSNWFIDANVGVYGFGACNGTTVRFFRTTNGGATWDSVLYTHPLDVAVGGITYANGAFYAGGGVGNFWKSTDNGANWTLSSTGSAGFAEDAMTSGGNIHLASVDGSVCGVSGSGKTSRSTDGGATWSHVSFPGVLMWSVSMYSTLEGWSCGDGGHAYYTSDGGVTWTEKSCGMVKTDRIDDIHFTDATHGWAVGDGVYKYVGDYYTKRPDTIDFGDIVVGSVSADSNARITAIGGAVVITNRIFNGPDFLHFQATNGLGPQNVASCGDGLTPVRFAPTSEGVKLAQIEFTIAGSPTTEIVYLRGRGVRPRIASSTALHFDTLLCAFTTTDTVWVRNNGSTTLNVTSASTSSLAGGSFRLLWPVPPAMIAPGDSIPFVVEATMTTPGSLGGTLSLYNNDPEAGKSPWIITLNAFKRRVSSAFSSDTLIVLPPAPFGVKSNGCIGYQNTGDGAQTIVGVAPEGGDPTITLSAPISGLRVGKGGAQDICFTATASDTFVHVRRFRITTDPCGLDTFVTVRYQALTAIISSSPTWLLTAGACDSNANEAVLITNRGNAPLILDKPYFGGADSAGFSLVGGTWPDTIPVGASRLVRIAFNFPPGGSSSHTGTITFPNNDGLPGKNLWTVTLTVARGASELSMSRQVIDAGDICLRDGRVEWAHFRNIGTAPAVIRALDTVTANNAVMIARTPVGTAVAPNGGDSIAFTIVPRVIGPFSASYAVRYDPCSRLDTITVIGRGVGIDLEQAPQSVNYGIVQAGSKETRSFKLTNNGNIQATIDEWVFTPLIAGARVVSPAPPLKLDPGASADVVVELTPPDVGSYQLTLTGIAKGICADTLRAPIEAIAIKGTVTTTKFKVDFGSIASCDNSASVDSVTLTNKGTSPINVTGLRVGKGSASGFALGSGIAPPRQVPPGDSLSVTIEIRSDASGDLADTLFIELDQPDQPLVAIPLAARRDRADLAIRDTSNASISSIAFETLTDCGGTALQRIRLVNSGTVADTITLGLTGASFTLLSPSSILLEPGRDTTITLRAAMTAPGADDGRLTIQSSPCALGGTVDLHAEYMTSAAAISAIDFQNVALGNTIEKIAGLTNRGSSGQVIDTLYIEGATGDYTINGAYKGATIAQGDTLPVRVSFAPSATGAAQARLVVILTEPCADTIYAAIAGVGVRDEIYPIHLTGGSARGRWGTTVAVPIGFENRRNAGAAGFDVDVTARPELLEPKGARIHATNATGWTVARTAFDATSGKLTLRLTPTTDASPLPTTDTLLLVEYEVLRGSEIASDIEIAAANLPSNIVATTEPGDFALEDYCDAHGRLLRVHGNIALEQNVPNPFNPETIIEFETAFEGHVVLAIYDGIGRELLRPVDEVLPPGRRRIRFDARDLPSGVYTYKLVTGLQVLTRQMVVTK